MQLKMCSSVTIEGSEHLNIIRIKSPDEEFVYVNIRENRLNDYYDVLFPQMLRSWAGAEALNLEDFME